MRTDNNPIEILQNLIACKSVTPNDDNCQTIIGEYLKQLGFEIKNIKYGDVHNMIAKLGTKKPTLAFVGHTDVCLLYTSPSPRDISGSRMPSSA